MGLCMMPGPPHVYVDSHRGNPCLCSVEIGKVLVVDIRLQNFPPSSIRFFYFRYYFDHRVNGY